MVSWFNNMSVCSQEQDNDLVGIWHNRGGDGAQWFGELVNKEAAEFAKRNIRDEDDGRGQEREKDYSIHKETNKGKTARR